MSPFNEAEIVAARLTEARAAHSRGWLLTPVTGKRPTLKAWTTAPPPSLEQVEEWARKGSLGLRTGVASGVVVIDDDTEDGSGVEVLNFPKTVTVITGSGKRHAYFKYPEGGLGNSVGKLAPGVDVRGDGGQVVYPGSIHPDKGRPYTWAPGLSPDEVELAELPHHVLKILRGATAQVEGDEPPPSAWPQDLNGNGERIRRYAQAALTKECEAVAGSQEGARNDTLNRAAFKLGRFVGMGALEGAEVESGLLEAARAAGLPAKEARATVTSGLSKGAKKPHRVKNLLRRLKGSGTGQGPPPLTDTGNAERLVARYGNDIRFCHPWKKWLVWDHGRWATDTAGRIMRLGKHVVRSILSGASRIEDKSVRDNTIAWALKSERAERRRAIVALAASEKGIPIMPSEMDRDPLLLNCLNGTINLRTGILRSHDRADLITKLVPVRFDPAAACPQWEKFIQRVLPDEDVRAFVQRAVGSSLTGDVGDQVLFFCYGLGANGKSVFLLILLAILGSDYAIQAAPDILLAKGKRDHPTELADLFGVRLAVCTEMGPERRFDEVLVKQLTGGDKVRARRMREDFWEFAPTHHLWLAANHKPIIRGTDHAIWRRILLVPFTVTIPEGERDPRLVQKLAKERPGILAWAVRGCLAWQQEGLAPPEKVLMATRDYREEMDVLGEFLATRVECRSDSQTPAKRLFEAYRAWCESTGEVPLTQRTFGLRLTERGFTRRKTLGVYVYERVRLRDAGESTHSEGRDEEGRTGRSSDINGIGGPHEGGNAESSSASSLIVPEPPLEPEAAAEHAAPGKAVEAPTPDEDAGPQPSPRERGDEPLSYRERVI